MREGEFIAPRCDALWPAFAARSADCPCEGVADRDWNDCQPPPRACVALDALVCARVVDCADRPEETSRDGAAFLDAPGLEAEVVLFPCPDPVLADSSCDAEAFLPFSFAAVERDSLTDFWACATSLLNDRAAGAAVPAKCWLDGVPARMVLGLAAWFVEARLALEGTAGSLPLMADACLNALALMECD